MSTRLGHLSLVAADRDELKAWRSASGRRHVHADQGLELGHHLNVRDPDDIALELYAPNARMAAALHELRMRDVPRDAVLAMARAAGGHDERGRGR